MDDIAISNINTAVHVDDSSMWQLTGLGRGGFHGHDTVRPSWRCNGKQTMVARVANDHVFGSVEAERGGRKQAKIVILRAVALATVCIVDHKSVVARVDNDNEVI